MQAGNQASSPKVFRKIVTFAQCFCKMMRKKGDRVLLINLRKKNHCNVLYLHSQSLCLIKSISIGKYFKV